MRFEQGNNYGKKSSRKGVPNKINKEQCVQLVNMLLEDLTTNYDALNQYQKLKLFGFMKDVLRDTLTPSEDQVGGVTIPQVIYINTTAQDDRSI